MPRTRKNVKTGSAAKAKAKPKAPVATERRVVKRRGRRRGLLSGLGSHEHERDILEQYLHEVSKTPLLTQKEEISLARKERAGDQEAMQELVKLNLRFVISVAKKHQNRELPLTHRELHRRGYAGHGRPGGGPLAGRRDRAGAHHAAAPRYEGDAPLLWARRWTRGHARRGRRNDGRHGRERPSARRPGAEAAA